MESHGGMIVTGKTEELGEELTQFPFFQNNSHVDCSGCEHGTPLQEASD
jgi:hypothetical protein